MDHGDGRRGPWTLTEVREGEQALLAQMVQFYLYDLSEIAHEDLGERGHYQYDLPDQFWDRAAYPSRHALILRVNGKPAGFALIDEESPRPDGAGSHYILEFHVLRAYRGEGYGRIMAWAVFNRFPGKWQIEPFGTDGGALSFWRRVIDAYTGGCYTERGLTGRRFHLVVQEFDTKDRVAT